MTKHVNMVEKVQMRVTKLIDGFSNVEYSDRLRELNLLTLTYRRARGDMIELYKHFYAYVDLYPSKRNTLLLEIKQATMIFLHQCSHTTIAKKFLSNLYPISQR